MQQLKLCRVLIALSATLSVVVVFVCYNGSPNRQTVETKTFKVMIKLISQWSLVYWSLN